MFVHLVLLGLLFGPAQSKSADPIGRATEWIERWGGSRAAAEGVSGDAIVRELAALEVRAPERRFDVAVALLDLAALRPRGVGPVEPDDDYRPDAATAAVRKEAVHALAALLETDARHELARELAVRVMVDASGQPLGRRVAALELFAGRYVRETELALLGESHSEVPLARRAALRALVGWPDDAVHRRMAGLLEESLVPGKARDDAFALQHFQSTILPTSSAACATVTRYLERGAAATDWRVATRALRVAPALTNDRAIPVLIAALETWVGRRESPAASLRIETEIARELERRSRRHLGNHPDRWRTWWDAERERRAAGVDADPDPETVAGFFGLKPASDRIVFVIDRSGSMDDPLGTGGMGGTTRWRAAVAQLLRFVEALGPNGRFRVIVFSDENWSSSREMKAATPRNVAALERWLAGQRPGGGTQLAPAVRAALSVDDHQRLVGELEADSVVILCDGQTAEGPGWVQPFLEAVNGERCVVFYGVQIGSVGDGTLEGLARASGGEFVVSLD
ncbi:MAG: VWA domain-containing protein [Planctomycetes bacterium]|nr:VWA domain-containing protein [Planctomycetota bacterium]